MVGFNGKLFVTLAPSLTGDGVLEEYDPGTDTFHQVSDPNLRVFELEQFNNYLYAGLGSDDTGYGLAKSDMSGTAPYTFTPIIDKGAGRGRTIASVVSMHVFKDRLYVGASGWNTSILPSSELIRVDPDDSWQLVVGKARNTPAGFKFPISGFPDGFGNIFNAHFWRMEDHGDGPADNLFLGTNDFSWLLKEIPWLDPLIKQQYGFDIYSSNNGVFWSLVTKDAFQHPFDFGARTFATTPPGSPLGAAFIGSANHAEGTRIFAVVDRRRPPRRHRLHRATRRHRPHHPRRRHHRRHRAAHHP